MKPYVLEGGIATDHRGSISFVNDFRFDNICRFYLVENKDESEVRAWHGHRKDIKHFYCVQGSFLISFVKIDDWENPSMSIAPERIILNANDSKILVIPAGYANSVKSLEPNSKLMSFSTLPIEEAEGDSVRYDKAMWSVE